MHGQQQLLTIIADRLRALGLSERKAVLAADVGEDFIRDIRRRGHSPKADKLVRLARVLQIPPARLLEAAELRGNGHGEPESIINFQGSELAQAHLSLCYIVGNVEAGAWRSAVELPRDEWEPMGCEYRPEFEGVRFGLRVRGPSMNRYYQPGTILDCVRFIGTNRAPRDGDHVIVYRRGPGDLIEATVKELVRSGDHWQLWPRSTHPDHQSPIELADIPGDDENEEIRLHALVIGAYTRRPV